MKNKISKELIEIFKTNISFKSLNLHEPDLLKSDIFNLKKCISTNNVSAAGEFVQKFEKEISKLTGAKYVITTNSGTSALQISCILAGVKRNDEVLIPSFTFIATTNAVKYCDAIPHFVDIEEEHFCINTKKLRNYLYKIAKVDKYNCINKITGRRIKAIIPVHIFGHPFNTVELLKIAKEFNLTIIEDAAEAIGSYANGRHVGSFGATSVLSFNGNKIVTCGAGGAILTNDKFIADQAKHLVATSKIKHPYKYIHDSVGYNFRMPNINAALGYSQIKRIKKTLNKKRKIFNFYKNLFKNSNFFKLISEPRKCKSNYWLNTILINKKYSNLTDEIISDLNKRKIHVRPGWELMTNLKFLKNSPKMDTTIAKSVSKRIINIPSSSFLVDYIKKY